MTGHWGEAEMPQILAGQALQGEEHRGIARLPGEKKQAGGEKEKGSELMLMHEWCTETGDHEDK